MRSKPRSPKEEDMPKFVIEREIPGAGKLTDQQVQAISRKSCDVLASMKGTVQWQHSYVTDDKLYCVYVAPNEEAVRQHAKQGDFPRWCANCGIHPPHAAHPGPGARDQWLGPLESDVQQSLCARSWLPGACRSCRGSDRGAV